MIKRQWICLLLVMAAMFGLYGCARVVTNPPKTEFYVNLNRYSGQWYEIAAYPNRFQRGCRCTMAEYQLKKTHLKVINRCVRGQAGRARYAQVTASATPIDDTNSKMKIQFFWPFKSDYWILYVSPRYRYAIVGDPRRQYLWFLARKPSISAYWLRKLKSIAKKRGYALDRLQMTVQNCGKFAKRRVVTPHYSHHAEDRMFNQSPRVLLEPTGE